MTSKYNRSITKLISVSDTVHLGDETCLATISVDVYDILAAWNVTNPATQHAIKKLLMPGTRGHKSTEQDLREARDSIERAIELEAQNAPF